MGDRAQSDIDLLGGARSALVVDLGAIVANWRLLAKRAAPAECAAVVKANAYGLGAGRVVPALAAAGCKTFFVASAAEGEACRRALGSDTADIYVLDGLAGTAPATFALNDLRPVLSSPEEVSAWTSAPSHALPFALHIDTGMARLGLMPDDCVGLHLTSKPALLMTHPACADDLADPMTARQAATFDRLCDALGDMARDVPRSFANSPATLSDPRYRYDLTRPGIALYGGRAVNEVANPMRAAVRLIARVLQVRSIAEGETVGYGATFAAKRPTRVATIAVGYADGVPRALGNAAGAQHPCVVIAGHACPLIGRVSMDLTTVDITEAPHGALTAGATADVIGPHLTIDDIADRTGTIGYEILTGLGARLPRVYVGAAETT
ncbi:MAG: alanine racemase [Pseudomonadota bacterium]